MVKNPPANAGDLRATGSVPRWERSPGEGNGNQLQHSCLENPMGRRTWWATVHGIAESDTSEVTVQYTHTSAQVPRSQEKFPLPRPQGFTLSWGNKHSVLGVFWPHPVACYQGSYLDPLQWKSGVLT